MDDDNPILATYTENEKVFTLNIWTYNEEKDQSSMKSIKKISITYRRT